MVEKELEHIISKINEAELVLVGLGEELDLTRQLKENECALSDADKSLAPFFKKNMLDKIQHQSKEVYENLAKCLKDKNIHLNLLKLPTRNLLKLPTRNLTTNPCFYLHYLPNYATIDISPEI